MDRFTIIILIFTVFGLFKDYKRDKGLNKKAKIYHSILLTLLLTSYAGSFRVLGSIIRNFDKVETLVNIDIGIIPGQVHFVLYFLNLVTSLIVLVFAYQMINRNEVARKRLLLFLPFLGILSVFTFYKGWVNSSGENIINDWTIILIGIIIIGSITTIYIKVYRSEWMKKFFTFEPSLNEFNAEEE